MKEFIKWLGVNEKVAKLVVWIFIFMAFLVLLNNCLDSFGLPYYKITAQNLSKIKLNKVLDYACTVVVAFLNFCSIVFLVLRLKEFKKILPYSILYLIILGIVSEISYPLMQAYIFVSITTLLFFYSGKKPKYILYSIYSFLFNIVCQYVFYNYKAKYIDFANISGLNWLYTSIDCFLVIFVIKTLKEVYLRNKEVK